MTFLRRPQANPLRKALFQVHLWAGVILALWVVLIGTTGAVLVFRQELQKLTFPKYFTVVSHGEPDAPPAQIIQNLLDAYPGYKLLGIDYPTYRRGTYLSYLTKGGELRTVFSHPVTGQVIGELPKASWITQLQDLHFDLLGGSTGRIVNGIGASILIAMFATGLVVWWPGLDRWRQSLWVNVKSGWRRMNWDVHSATGFWLFALLMLWAVTGIEFAFPQAFRSGVNAVSPLTTFHAPLSNVPSGQMTKAADISQLVEKAQGLARGARPGRVVLPANSNAAILILLARVEHGDFDTSDEILLYFDQYSGQLLQRREAALEAQTAGDLVMKWIGPLHVGSFGGLGVKLLWSIVALSFPALALTGVIMWWNRVVRPRLRTARLEVSSSP